MEKKRLKYFSTLTFCLSLSYSVVADSLQPHGLQPTRLLSPWDFPGKNTGVGCCFLLQGIFLTQGSNLGLPHCRQTLYRLSHQGSTLTHLKKILCSLSFSKIIVFKREKQNRGPKQWSDHREVCGLCQSTAASRLEGTRVTPGFLDL